ncbi:hypothetical protein Tco_0045493 [Tanacetum coccineum]
MGCRVTASEIADRIDRVTRIIFGVGRKSSPENFSGDGRRWPEVGRRWLPDLRERERELEDLKVLRKFESRFDKEGTKSMAAEQQEDQQQQQIMLDAQLVPINDQVKIGFNNFRIALEKS